MAAFVVVSQSVCCGIVRFVDDRLRMYTPTDRPTNLNKRGQSLLCWSDDVDRSCPFHHSPEAAATAAETKRDETSE